MLLTKPFPKMFLQKQRLALEGGETQSRDDCQASKALAVRDSGAVAISGGGRDFGASGGSKYDHLKRAAEKLMIQQATASTDLELMRSSLTKGEAIRTQQEDYIKELTEDKARLSSLLKSEREVLAKLTFDVTATQALCASLKESYQFFQEKINEASSDRAILQRTLTERNEGISSLRAKLERKEQSNAELNKTLNETRDDYQRYVLETSDKVAKLTKEKQAVEDLASTQEIQLREIQEKCELQESKIKQLENDHLNLTEQLKSLQSDSDVYRLSSETAAVEQQQALKIANDALIESLLKLETAEEDNRVLHLKTLELEKSIAELEDSHRLATEEFHVREQELQATVGTATVAKKNLEENIRELSERYETVVEECVMSRASVTAEKLHNEDLVARIKMKSVEIVAVTSQLETLTKEFDEAKQIHTKELERLREENKIEREGLIDSSNKSKEGFLKESEEKLNHQIAQLLEERENAICALRVTKENEVQLLQEEFNSKESRLSALLSEKEEELAKAQRKIQDLVHSLSSELLSIKQKHDSELETVQTSSKEESRALKKQLKETTKEKRSIQDQVDQLNTRVKELTLENESLKEKQAKEKKSKMNILDMPAKFSFTKKDARNAEKAEKAKLQDDSIKSPEKKEQKESKEPKELKESKSKEQKEQKESKIIKETNLKQQKEATIQISSPQKAAETKKRTRKGADSDFDSEWKGREVTKKKSAKPVASPVPKTKTRKIQETTTIKKFSKVEPKQTSKLDAASSTDSSKRIRKTVCRSQMDLFEDVFTFNE